MPINNSNEATIAQRRELVTRLRLRGKTLREIAVGLERAGIVNPQTGQAYTHATIKNDLDYLLLEWRENASQDIAIYHARHLAKLEELWRLAMNDNDYMLALRVLDKEINLLGTPRLQQAQIDLLEQAVQDIRAGVLTYEPLASEVGDDLAQQLFARAGVAVEVRPGEGE